MARQSAHRLVVLFGVFGGLTTLSTPQSAQAEDMESGRLNNVLSGLTSTLPPITTIDVAAGVAKVFEGRTNCQATGSREAIAPALRVSASRVAHGVVDAVGEDRWATWCTSRTGAPGSRRRWSAIACSRPVEAEAAGITPSVGAPHARVASDGVCRRPSQTVASAASAAPIIAPARAPPAAARPGRGLIGASGVVAGSRTSSRISWRSFPAISARILATNAAPARFAMREAS